MNKKFINVLPAAAVLLIIFLILIPDVFKGNMFMSFIASFFVCTSFSFYYIYIKNRWSLKNIFIYYICSLLIVLIVGLSDMTILLVLLPLIIIVSYYAKEKLFLYSTVTAFVFMFLLTVFFIEAENIIQIFEQLCIKIFLVLFADMAIIFFINIYEILAKSKNDPGIIQKTKERLSGYAGTMSLIMMFLYIPFLLAVFFLSADSFNRIIIDEYYYKGVNLIPFSTIVNYIKHSEYFNVMIIFKNIIGNILLLMPAGFFIPIIIKSKIRWYIVIFSILIFSFLIEITQYKFHLGSFDVDDIILNTTGSIIGLVLYKIYFNLPGKLYEKIRS